MYIVFNATASPCSTIKLWWECCITFTHHPLRYSYQYKCRTGVIVVDIYKSNLVLLPWIYTKPH